jgi:hypothetical protein
MDETTYTKEDMHEQMQGRTEEVELETFADEQEWPMEADQATTLFGIRVMNGIRTHELGGVRCMRGQTDSG